MIFHSALYMHPIVKFDSGFAGSVYYFKHCVGTYTENITDLISDLQPPKMKKVNLNELNMSVEMRF